MKFIVMCECIGIVVLSVMLIVSCFLGIVVVVGVSVVSVIEFV